jgi:transposase-like protein
MRLSGLSFLGGLVAMTLVDVNSMFSTDDKCRELLKKLRWPHGVKCLRCGGPNTFEVSNYKYECRECSYQFTVTAQSIFHDSHLPLTTWFLAVLLIVEARKGISANQLKRTLGVAYKTAWYLCHRIRHAMDETAKGAPKLADGGGVIEMDETYVGGKRSGKRGRGAEGKEIVIGIREREGELRFFKAEDVRAARWQSIFRSTSARMWMSS